MRTTVMSVRTDRRLKEKAQKVAEELGFRLGTLINAFLRQLVKDKAVSFSTGQREELSERAKKELREIDEDIRKGRNLSPKFDNLEDAFAYLDGGE